MYTSGVYSTFTTGLKTKENSLCAYVHSTEQPAKLL